MLDPWVLGRIFLSLVSVSGVGLTGLAARSEAASVSCSGFSGFIVLLSLDGKGNVTHGAVDAKWCLPPQEFLQAWGHVIVSARMRTSMRSCCLLSEEIQPHPSNDQGQTKELRNPTRNAGLQGSII